MVKFRGYLLCVAFLPAIVAQIETCVSLAASSVCSAFNASSISTDTFMIGLYPFLQGVTDAASFDRNLTAYVRSGYVSLKFGTLFGCSNIDLQNTTNLYARFTTTVVCNGVVQNSISRCGLSAAVSSPVCADTCIQAQYALSEQVIVADTRLCSNPSNYTDTQLRADYTNCGLPTNALRRTDCIEGIANEPESCGFGYSALGFCQYCGSGGSNPTDPCCGRYQASSRCAGVVLPTITTSAILSTSPTSTSSSSSVSTSMATTTPSTATQDVPAASSGLGLSGGAIAGIVVGSVAGLILVILLILLCCRRRRKQVAQTKQDMATVAPEMGYNQSDASSSSIGRAPSAYDALTTGGMREAGSAPGTYSLPPFIGVGQSETSPSDRHQHSSSISSDYVMLPGGRRARNAPSIIGSDDGRGLTDQFPSPPLNGFVSTHQRAISSTPSEYLILPGGRRVKMPTDDTATDDGRGLTSSGAPVSSSVARERRTSIVARSIASVTAALPPAPVNKEDYEILPGGRIARKAGLTGFVGGASASETIQNQDANATTSTEPEASSSNARQGETEEITPNNNSKAPLSLPSSLIKDYYSPESICPGDKVVAVWSYEPRTRDEFALERGDVLQVTSIWSDGWAIGFMVKEAPAGGTTTQGSSEVAQSIRSSGQNGEAKAFPLVCVCLSKYSKRVFQAGGMPVSAVEDDDNAA